MPSAFYCAWRPHRSTDEDSPVAGPSSWNELPALLRNDELSAMSFRRQLKTELYIRDTSTLVTVFTVRVGEHNFIVLTYLFTRFMIK